MGILIKPSDLAGTFVAEKPSGSKEIRWAVGDEFKVCNVRPALPHETSNCYVTFKPAQEIKGFRQIFEVSEEVFRNCFKRKS